ncbi:hypothetical protein [Streptomyces sp. NPDC059278]|uniref:hypothetical protein n=1 Tax=Streptomyces sp. NPDC059278 TaxID=3346801 RepID=UPI0036A557FC
MGRPGVLKKPQLDRGPLKTLMDSLHELHLDVGRPSLTKIAEKSKETDRDLSRSTIAYLMSEPRLPDFDGMQKLVAVLVELPPVSRPMNLDTTLTRFIALWKQAAKAENSPPPSPLVQELTKTGNAYLKVAAAYQRAETMEANAVSADMVANEWEYVAERSDELLGEGHPVAAEARERADSKQAAR